MQAIPYDMFATKGVEYLLVIGFLGALVLFWRLLKRPAGAEPDVAGTRSSGWFRVPAGLYYHPGHSWVRPGDSDLVTVGIDDFAQRLIGIPSAVELPSVGDELAQGEPGPGFRLGSKVVRLLSPVDGEVVARNDEVLSAPELVNRDPYREGWLLKIRPKRMSFNLRNLLEGSLATAWMTAAEEELRARMSPGLGVVLQDGGVPITGIARSMFGDEWDRVAEELLLSG